MNYSWDNNGNLLSDGVNSYTYDQANRLVSVNGQITFAYNGMGDRLRQTVSGNTTNYILDLNVGLTQVMDDGTKTYLYGLGRLGQYDNAMQYFGVDGLGSVRQLYDDTGAALANMRYAPFGNLMSGTGAASIYGYTGEQTDATGLVYLRARYFDMGRGRFTTRDTWEGDYQRPLSLNRWNYVGGNPVDLVDPSGLQGQDFRVNVQDAKGPSERKFVLSEFKDAHWNLGSADIWDVLGREIDFVVWMQQSERLTENHSRKGNWYDVSDEYLTASRFAGERLAKYLEANWQCQNGSAPIGPVEPGVAEWANLVMITDGVLTPAKVGILLGHPEFGTIASTGLNMFFWRAHNEALREGVRRADSRGLRRLEPLYERQLINFVLYDVLEPGDQCANGNLGFCAFTAPLELKIGAFGIYPQTYPATEGDLLKVGIAFTPIYMMWDRLGARAPSQEDHLNDESIPGAGTYFGLAHLWNRSYDKLRELQ